jgi:tetratricopeptide (TPR) repeat protein
MSTSPPSGSRRSPALNGLPVLSAIVAFCLLRTGRPGAAGAPGDCASVQQELIRAVAATRDVLGDLDDKVQSAVAPVMRRDALPAGVADDWLPQSLEQAPYIVWDAGRTYHNGGGDGRRVWGHRDIAIEFYLEVRGVQKRPRAWLYPSATGGDLNCSSPPFGSQALPALSHEANISLDLGRAYLDAGRFSEAVQALERGLQLDPSQWGTFAISVASAKAGAVEAARGYPDVSPPLVSILKTLLRCVCRPL